MSSELNKLEAGTPIVFGGNRVVRVGEALAAAFEAGDRLVVVQTTGDLLHIPAVDHDIAERAVGAAAAAFGQMGAVTDEQITAFYDAFARRLEDDASFGPIREANAADVEAARAKGKSTTRLVLSDKMRGNMISGLRTWRDATTSRGAVVETVAHTGWRVELVRSGLGVVGFVFEGRPNVFADATGVLRSGNAVAFRIGSAALGTARAMMKHALEPALAESGLPPGAASLVDTPSRAAGWAMFSNPRLALAVARGSGQAVAQLGAVARQAGIPVSLHGTGGAWIVAGEAARADVFGAAVYNSLDRKVCNTLNTCCIVESRAQELVATLLEALDRAGARRGTQPKLHVTASARPYIPEAWFTSVSIARAGGGVDEAKTELIADDDLGVEWEWEDSPEITLTVVPDMAAAVGLFNRQSPRFVASLISPDQDEQRQFWAMIAGVYRPRRRMVSLPCGGRPLRPAMMDLRMCGGWAPGAAGGHLNRVLGVVPRVGL